MLHTFDILLVDATVRGQRMHVNVEVIFHAHSPDGVPRGGMAPIEVSQQELPVAPGPRARPDDAVVRYVALESVAIGSGNKS